MTRIAATCKTKLTFSVVKRNLCCKQLRNFYNTGIHKEASFPTCDYTPSVYKGASYETIIKSRENYVIPSQKPYYKKPLLLHEGRGQWVWDNEGRRYLDMFGGIATISVGYCHPKVVCAMSEQSYKLGHATAVYLHPRYHEYAEKLTSRLPPGLSCVYLTNSGSEATELSIQLARLYTGRNEIISLKNCYHGATAVAAATTAISTYKYPLLLPPGHIHVTNPDVYQGPWGGSNCRDSPVQAGNRICNCAEGKCQAEDNYFKQFQDTYESLVPADGQIAAFIAESIQGVGGTVQYPRGYLKRVQKQVHELGGIFIADEVQTGFGRTGGSFWGFEGHGLNPDIVTMAKGIGNGFPLGAVVTRPEIARALTKAHYFNTYGGNPIGCAVGAAVLDIIEEESLQENALNVGTHILYNLATLIKEFPSIMGDVRGKGLMIGIELVNDSTTREPLPHDEMAQIFEDIKDMGVLFGKGGVKGNVLRLKPPLCVTKEDGDYAVEVLRSALKKHQTNIKC
ncbi:PREDICTED: alanine--glyoxylate aminotransferase 2, mitochondrial [Ceratosolen solmsi marchali]|uniref:Alanine--glyoxylate aminotransferase 2, mitochondrial n=1 Tax=Ceratosolen solmsi marchali TaxID=326594 RepID=A0AAJ6YS44_9HYME|nr:PREDICTED: alanine--glyoxylate aminotransferase 2, mitochondrial [Ceratosolen solmsi marchali]